MGGIFPLSTHDFVVNFLAKNPKTAWCADSDFYLAAGKREDFDVYILANDDRFINLTS